MTTSADIRDRLVETLQLDLVGPGPGHPLEAEQLWDRAAPSRWYLTGFLVPTEAPKSSAPIRRPTRSSTPRSGPRTAPATTTSSPTLRPPARPMLAAYPLPTPAEIARAKAVGQIHVLMRAGGVQVTEDEVAAALRTMPDERLLAVPGELAEALDWHRIHAPAEIPRIFRAELEQLQRHAAAGEPPLTDDDIEAEIQAARADRDRRAS